MKRTGEWYEYRYGILIKQGAIYYLLMEKQNDTFQGAV